MASWGFIEFEHNRHQVEEARSRAQALGFRAFRLRRSYAESAEIRRPPETPNDGARIAALWKSGEVPVEPDPFPYIQADGTLYPCCESNSGRYDPKIDFDFARLNLRRHGLSECLRVLPDYCATMQATYPLTCARRCGRFPEGQGPAGQDIGYGRAAGGG